MQLDAAVSDTSTQSSPTLPDEAIFDPRPVVLKMTSLSATQLYTAIKKEGFPQPYQIGPRRVAWNRAEVLAWMASRPRGTRSKEV